MFYNKPIFKEFAVSLTVTAVLNIIALYYSFYSTIDHFDSLMHFLGGATVSFAILWFYFFSELFYPQRRTIMSFFLMSFSGVIFIGVSWEIFELVSGITSVLDPVYPFDTAMDLTMNILGAAAACLYAYMNEIPNANTESND